MSRANEPAYPSHGTMGEVVQQGLTIREHFAANVLQGMLSGNPTRCKPSEADAREAAEIAVMIADALLAILQRPQRGEGE